MKWNPFLRLLYALLIFGVALMMLLSRTLATSQGHLSDVVFRMVLAGLLVSLGIWWILSLKTKQQVANYWMNLGTHRAGKMLGWMGGGVLLVGSSTIWLLGLQTELISDLLILLQLMILAIGFVLAFPYLDHRWQSSPRRVLRAHQAALTQASSLKTESLSRNQNEAVEGTNFFYGFQGVLTLGIFLMAFYRFWTQDWILACLHLLTGGILLLSWKKSVSRNKEK